MSVPRWDFWSIFEEVPFRDVSFCYSRHIRCLWYTSRTVICFYALFWVSIFTVCYYNYNDYLWSILLGAIRIDVTLKLWHTLNMRFTINAPASWHSFKRVTTWEKVHSDRCAQRRLKSACTPTLSDQSLVVHMKKLCIRDSPKSTKGRLRSGCANAQTGQNLRWAHIRRYVF